jgi:NADPH:quinone reductase-like Zn-dependent oxidoreductase
MKLRYKILIGFVAILALVTTALVIVLSYETECPPPMSAAAGADTMKAVIYRCYGSSEVIEFVDLPKPEPADNEILVKIEAVAVNPLDWHYMRGSPYIMRLMSGLGAPDDTRLGVDFAGTVETVGAGVTRFEPGDEVFGGRTGAFAEYIKMPEDRAVARKPANVSFEEAAAIPIAAVTALQALRDSGQLEAGQKVLINGASGGVGTYAVQIAKSFGAEVHGVCSTRNVEMVRALGAAHVFDYKTENYTESDERYDLIVDMVGSQPLLANRRVMTPEGRLVMVGGPKGDWVGPLLRPIRSMLLSPFVDQEFTTMLAHLKQGDLQLLAELMEDDEIRSRIDRRYPLDELRDAIDYSESGRARGKIIILP